MKRNWIVLASACLVVLAGAVTAANFSVAHAGTTGAAKDATIAVMGHGDKQVQPDMATIDAGITTKGKDAKSAQKANDTAMNQLLSSLKTAGVASGDIHTQYYSIHPDYGIPDKTGHSQITGFEADDNIEITVHQLSKVGSLVDLVVQSGATQVNGINYQVSNPRALQQSLYDAALADAKAQAQHIASTLGVQITGVQTVDTTQNGGYLPGPIVRMSAATAQSAAPISPGPQNVSTDIKVVYTIS